MRTMRLGAPLLALGLVACAKEPNSVTASRRMEIRKVTGNVVQFVPSPGELRYCLVYSHSQKGLIRQLTMSKSNQSVPCPAGQPVMGLRFRIPIEEGPTKIYSFFSDQRLQAEGVSEQIVELEKPNFNPMDMRLPGKVTVEAQNFTPTEEPTPSEGEVVGAPMAGQDGPASARAR